MTRALARTRTSTSRKARRALRRGVVGVAAAGAALTGLALAPASAAPTVFQVSSAAGLEQLAPTLTAGDTVDLAPGTYALGAWRPQLVDFGHHAIGTAAAPITITAADPAHPPTLQGSFEFDGLSYWNFSHLRFQGTLAGKDTLTFDGGTGWQLLDSEVFGARVTGALANVVVAEVQTRFGMPTNWVISGNSIHDSGATKSKAGKQHEIYLTAAGDAHGLIVRNLFYNTPEGAAVKIGNGGLANSPGINYVQVDDNTMFNGFEQILMHGNVSHDSVVGNLMVDSTRAMGNGDTVGVYLAGVTGSNNLISHNYFSRLTLPVYNNHSGAQTFTNGGGNAVRANPRFDRAAAFAFHPETVAAQAFGAYAPVSYWD
jgi:hypothetical protein